MALADIRIHFTVTEAGRVVEQLPEKRVAFGTGSLLPKRERISLTASSFTALSPPSGAQMLILDPESAISLILKGITGDQGIPIVPASNPTGALLSIPLGSSPSVGLANGHTSAQVVTCLWL